MKVEELRTKSPTLLLDAGNALFAGGGLEDERLRKKAELILKALGEMKAAGMAVGLRDLNVGPAWLKERAQQAKLPLLSANLKLNGKPVFEPSRVVTVGGVRVGLVGVTAPATFAAFPGLLSESPVPAAISEAKKLKGKVDLVVVLGAIPHADALELVRQAPQDLDLVFQSGDSRSGLSPSQPGDTAFVVSGGERGRILEQVEVDLSHGLSRKLPLVDATVTARQRMRISLLDNQISETRRRLAATHDEAIVREYKATLASFEQQRALVVKEVEHASPPGGPGGGRPFTVQPIELGPDVPSDPTLQAAASGLEPVHL